RLQLRPPSLLPRDETHLARVAKVDDPARDSRLGVGLRIRLEMAVLLPALADRRGNGERYRVVLAALVQNSLALLAAHAHLFGHGLGLGICRIGTHAFNPSR